MKSIVPFVLVALVAVSACGKDSSDSNPTAPSANVPFSTIDVRVGTGAEVANGRTLNVQYAGHLYSATAADNKGSQFGAGPLPLFVYPGNLIQGFNMGLQGMRAGGLRRVIIPPNLGYGNNPP